MASLGLSLLVAVLAALLSKDVTQDDVHDLFTSDFSGLFILLLGVTGMAGEVAPPDNHRDGAGGAEARTSGAPNAVTDASFGDEAHLSAGMGLLVMLGWVGVLFAAGGITLRQRDLV